MKPGYFDDDLFGFLGDLATHNERAWFEQNRARYEAKVRDPFLRFLNDLEPKLRKIAPHVIVDSRPSGGSMMRIHRDTRFSKDKSPYKTNIAAHFELEGVEGGPAFYLHLQPGKSAVGGGMWRPEPATLKRVRDAIVAESTKWSRATRGAELRSACGFLGESLKRPPAGYDAEHPHIEDIKRKDFAMSAPLTDAQVTSSDFMGLVAEGFKRTKPFVSFLAEAVGGTL